MQPRTLRRAGRRALSALAAAIVYAASPLARAGTTVHFAFDDDRYLRPGEHDGATAYVPDEATAANEPVPIVVFLHGINPEGDLHVWMEGDHDLRPVVDTLVSNGVEPFVLAAPSQTRDAGRGRDLWPDFDVDDFVAKTASAVARHADVDVRRVYVIGHSGAGCNARGGIAAAASATRAHVQGVLAVDTCMDADSGGMLARIPSRVPVWVTWENRAWPRDVDEFKDALGDAATRVRIQLLDVPGQHPHQDIVPRAFRLMARAWLSPQSD